MAERMPREQPVEKGLKPGALGLISSTVMGVASAAPAYSLAATLGFVVVAIGLQSPAAALLAFVPMLLASIGFSEMNKAHPDCGTTFTWAARAFGPMTGWAGGWAIVAADVLVMASLAQIAGAYVFEFFNDSAIGGNLTSGWVLLAGIIWIIAMTAICYVGIEVSANLQKVLLSIEVLMLLVLSVAALVKVYGGHAPVGSTHPAWSWFDPLKSHPPALIAGLVLFLFVYWGWDTTLSVNEETRDRTRIPGLAAIISTLVLLVTYVLVTTSVLAYAGVGTGGIGLGNPKNEDDVLSVLGHSVFGTAGIGPALTHLLILMVLSSAVASTQTTILPTARTTLSMAAAPKALPSPFARMHPRYLTPSVSTIVMGLVSIAVYVPMNYLSGGLVIVDAVTAIGLYIAFYYGLTAFCCVWYYRTTLTDNAYNLWVRGILPCCGGLLLWGAGIYSMQYDWVRTNSSTFLTLPGLHWQVGGAFVIAFVSALVGVIALIYCWITAPAYFKKQTLTRATPDD